MAIVRAALAAVDAGVLVRQALAAPDVAAALRSAAAVDVVAAGKAAAPMLMSFLQASAVPVRHAVGVAAEPPATPLSGVRWHTTAHPVPDERSTRAAHEVLGLARAATDRDLLVLLLSGGASSIVALSAEGVTLADKQRTAQQLLALGAEIHHLNTVRKHLSAIKGGWLAAAMPGATCTLALSDVVGDDLSAIGSGPAVPDPTTYHEALEVFGRYGGHRMYPDTVVRRLTRGAAGEIPETPKPGDPRLARASARVIGGARTAVAGAHDAAAALGYAVHIVDGPITGDACDAARHLLQYVGRVPRLGHDSSSCGPAGPAVPACILSAGETTVRTAGTGKGGRNQEFALAMVRGLDTLGPSVAAASVGTDGIDGPTDAAGAIVDSTTAARAQATHLGAPEQYLEEHNSYIFFDGLHDLIRTGPTGTNVGDLQVILVGSRQ